MKIIVDIPENIIDTINDDQFISREQLAVLQKHIMDGAAYFENTPAVEPSQNAEHDATQYSTGYQDGFLEAKKLFTDPENAAALEKITAEIVSILKDVMPQVVEIAKEYATGNGTKGGQANE